MQQRAPDAAGSLREYPLPKLLFYLYRKRFTGVLRVVHDARPSLVYVREGMPVHAERVGSDAGLLDSSDGDTKRQLIELILPLFALRDAPFALYREDHVYAREATEAAQLRVHPRRLIAEGVRASYTLPRLLAELGPTAEAAFRVEPDKRANLERYLFDDQERAVLPFLEGEGRDLPALAAGAGGDDLVVTRVVYTLIVTDLLTTIEGQRPAADPTATSAPATEARPVATPVPFGQRPPTLAGRPRRVAVRPDQQPEDTAASVHRAGNNAPPTRTGTLLPGTYHPATTTPGSRPVTLAPGRSGARTRPPMTIASPAPVTKPRTVRPQSQVPGLVLGGRAHTLVPGYGADSTPAPRQEEQRPGAGVISDFRNEQHSPEGAALAAQVEERLRTIDHPDNFALLGVGRSASPDEVRRAFMQAVRTFHPDRATQVGLPALRVDLERILSRLTEAQSVLTNPNRRADHIAALDGQPSGAEQVERAVAAEAAFQQGEIALRSKKFDAAEEHLRRALELNADEGEHHALYAWAVFCNPSHNRGVTSAKVRRQLLKAIELSPRNPRGYYLLGEVCLAEADLSEAIVQFRRALALSEDHADAARGLRLAISRKEKERAGLIDRIWRR
jgi:hypothetical protein